MGSGIPIGAPSEDLSIVAYATVIEGNTYCLTRMDTGAWDNAEEVDKEKALKQATRSIDRLNFAGEKTGADQTLQFPRDDDSDIPIDIKIACIECAIAILDGVDVEQELRTLELDNVGFSSVRTTYARAYQLEYLAAGIQSGVAWNYLKPYLRESRSINLSRVS